jgi:prefoldin alpha subunit
LNIGAGIAVEKTYDSAINYLEAKIKEIEIALQDTSAKKQEVIARLEHGKEQMNSLMQESSQNTSG